MCVRTYVKAKPKFNWFSTFYLFSSTYRNFKDFSSCFHVLSFYSQGQIRTVWKRISLVLKCSSIREKFCRCAVMLPKENQNGGNEWLKVDMPIVVSVGVENNVTKHLHSDDCIDEEQHPYQQDDIGKSLAKISVI